MLLARLQRIKDSIYETLVPFFHDVIYSLSSVYDCLKLFSSLLFPPLIFAEVIIKQWF